MATLEVRNVSAELYEALREHASKKGMSVSAAALEILRDNIETEGDLRRDHKFVHELTKLLRNGSRRGRRS